MSSKPLRSTRCAKRGRIEFPRSGQQSRESWKVKVLPPSIARFGRLAYPLLGEVTDRDRRGRKSHGCPVVGDRRWVVAMGVGLRASAKAMGYPPNPTAATQGLTRRLRCGGNDLGGESKPGGLNMREWLQPR